MASLSCEVLIESVADDAVLALVHDYLKRRADELRETRKGRVWEALFGNLPIHVEARADSPSIEFWCPGRSQPLVEVMESISRDLASILDGVAEPPM